MISAVMCLYRLWLSAGISFENISQLSGRLMDGVAAVSALFSAGNPKKAAQDLREKIDSMYSSAGSAK